MTKFVSVLADKGSETVVTVSEAFAKGRGLDVLDQPATNAAGNPLPPREVQQAADDSRTVAELKSYADEHDIDLGGATKKADILAAINAAAQNGAPQ